MNARFNTFGILAGITNHEIGTSNNLLLFKHLEDLHRFSKIYILIYTLDCSSIAAFDTK